MVTAASRFQTASTLRFPSPRLAAATPRTERRIGLQRSASSSSRSTVDGPGIDLSESPPAVVQGSTRTGLDDHQTAVASIRNRLPYGSPLSAASWQLRRHAVVPDAAVELDVDEQLALAAVERVAEPAAVVDAEQLQPRVLLAFLVTAVIELAFVIVAQLGRGRPVGSLLVEVRVVALPAAVADVAAADDELVAVVVVVAAAVVVVAAELAVAAVAAAAAAGDA